MLIYSNIFLPVSITFGGDWDTITAQVNQTILEKQMKASIVAALNVAESRVQNVKCTKGSIVTTFQLRPLTNDTQSTLDTRIDSLKQTVDSGTFVVNLKDGLSVTASRLTHAFQYTTIMTGEKSEIVESNNWVLPVVVVLVVLIGGGLAGIGAYHYFRQQNPNAQGVLCC